MKAIFILTVLMLSIEVQAGLFRAESETLNSFRYNENSQLEAPTYEFVAASYMTEKRDIEINSNFSLFTDPTGNNSNKAFLYILDARFEAVPDVLTFKIGRSFDVVNMVGVGSVDLISTELSLFGKQLRIGAFTGIQRQLEAYNSNLQANLVGGRIDFHTNNDLPLYLVSKFVQRYTPGRSVEDLVQLSGRKAFSGAWSPEFIIDSETDVMISNLNRLEAGFDLYPSIKTFSKIRFMTYDVQPMTGLEQPIFSIFSPGPLLEGRFQFENKFSSVFVGSFSVFYDDYQLNSTQRTQGQGGELEGKCFFGGGLNFNDVVYYFNSYGGTVTGNRISVQKQTSQKNEFYGLLDATYYQKITSSNRPAYTTEIGWTRILGSKFKLTLAAQESSNNVLKYDFRSIAKLTILVWDEI